jgi:nucleoside-diphosphate-sugar epimerase
MAKRVLVTGGAGFIGSHLVDSLLKDNFEVICVDNLISGKKVNVAQHERSGGFTFIKADVSKDDLNLKDIDFIFHLASPASPVDYQNYPLETALANSAGTLKMLELAKKEGAKFLLASTSEVYGDPLEHPQKETYWGNVNSFGPRSCYDESKRFAEALTYIFLHEDNVDARIIRIFNTYGPRMRKNDGRVISNFINQALKDKDITVYGKGNQTRSFCYISDMVDGIKKAMFTKNTKREVFNLGNPEEYTILELAKKIKEKLNAKSEVVFKPLPKDDPTQRKPDITKAKTILGWEPKVSVDEGLEETVNYYSSLK